ncbi:hypothetical protein C8K15_101115 [Paenisporosarcina sp. OV554]|nr:hypothetical protein C8K15_101115 [Paenisporosarcina sp. OV554]
MENDPLLFVQGPPVYRHIPMVSYWQEESTSIFPEPIIKAVEKEAVEKDPVEKDPIMWNRLRFLKTDFAKHVYKPLCFHLQDGEKVYGVVEEINPDSVQIKLTDGEITAFEIKEIQEIWWRGKILPTRM